MLPPFLNLSDQIRILSPSGVIDSKCIDDSINILTDWGLKVTEGKYARSEYGRFAGTPAERAEDLQQALDDPSVKAILCSRGGYGLAQIIDKLDFTGFVKSPKWVIGFSDISILHNAISNLGIASIHGIMGMHLSALPVDSEQTQSIKNILFGKLPSYNLSNETNNRTGQATGKLIGGNLAVLMGLRGSRFDMKPKDAILFIEDIGEKPYQIDRMIQGLRLGGVLAQLSGLIVGQFSECDEDPLMMQSIQEIILNAVKEYDYPVCFNFPAGHVEYNLPLVLGTKVQLFITKERAEVVY
jgi:muramoyltetrapeptide carboxypeptidase